MLLFFYAWLGVLKEKKSKLKGEVWTKKEQVEGEKYKKRSKLKIGVDKKGAS